MPTERLAMRHVRDVQPLATHTIGSLLRKQRSFQNVECKPELLESEFRSPTEWQRTDRCRTASGNTLPGSFQAIATAYGDYTKKSFEDTKLFVERLSGVKSLDKAIEVQTEFAKTAYETFVTESQKIGALYGDLAKQSYNPFGGFVAKMTPTNR
jgi:hypothetical protein